MNEIDIIDINIDLINVAIKQSKEKVEYLIMHSTTLTLLHQYGYKGNFFEHDNYRVYGIPIAVCNSLPIGVIKFVRKVAK